MKINLSDPLGTWFLGLAFGFAIGFITAGAIFA